MSTELSADAKAKIRQLQEVYYASLPEKMTAIEEQFSRMEKNADDDGRFELKTLVHKLAGSAGMYGLGEVSHIAKKIDLALASNTFDHQQIADDIAKIYSLIPK